VSVDVSSCFLNAFLFFLLILLRAKTLVDDSPTQKVGLGNLHDCPFFMPPPAAQFPQRRWLIFDPACNVGLRSITRKNASPEMLHLHAPQY
jgi:hypothetical protein